MSDRIKSKEKAQKKPAIVKHDIHDGILSVLCGGVWNTHTVYLIDDDLREL